MRHHKMAVGWYQGAARQLRLAALCVQSLLVGPAVQECTMSRITSVSCSKQGSKKLAKNDTLRDVCRCVCVCVCGLCRVAVK